MSRTSGVKRKIASTDASEQCNGIDVNDEYCQSIDDEIDSAIAKIKEGSHVELQNKAQALNRAKENKMADADRHRKMQIKNVNLQYEYDLEDANALFNKAYGETQEEMIQDLHNEGIRLKNLYRQKQLQQSANEEQTTAMKNTQRMYAQPTTAAGDKSSAHARSTRSSGLDADYAQADSMIFRGSESTLGGSQNTTARSRVKRPSTINGIPPLDQVLPESSMRSDLLEIVRDLQDQAKAFELSKPKTFSKPIVVSGDCADISVGNEVFSIGDAVTAFSALSQEHLSGILSAISQRELVVRTGSGARFSFLISQLRNGRVTLSVDHEARENIEMMRTALQHSNEMGVLSLS